MNPRIAVALLLVGVLALGAIVLAANSGGDDDAEPVAAENDFAGAAHAGGPARRRTSS